MLIAAYVFITKFITSAVAYTNPFFSFQFDALAERSSTLHERMAVDGILIK